MDSPPLHALRNTNGVVNGVFSYSGSSTFPTSSTDASNYWVDPVFTPQTFNHAARPGRQRQRDRWLRLGHRDLVGSDDG